MSGKLNARILIVDDVSTNIDILREVLKHHYKLSVALNGKQALKIATSSSPPDLILLDIMMPEMDGYEVCRRLKADVKTRDIPVLFITALQGESDENLGFSVGAIDFISKPINPSTVLSRVKSQLLLREAQQQLVKQNDQLLFERQAIESVLFRMRESVQFDGRNLKLLDRPKEKTGGDILLSSLRPDGGHNVLLGDFTGHGLIAAIGGPVLADLFYALTQQGAKIDEISFQVNRRLHQVLPRGMAMAGIFMDLDPERKNLTVLNCASPDLLVFREETIIHRVESGYPSRGFIDRKEEPGPFFPVLPGDRVIACTDGFVETVNLENTMFGQSRMDRLLTKLLKENRPMEELLMVLKKYRQGKEQLDDMTLVEWIC